MGFLTRTDLIREVTGAFGLTAREAEMAWPLDQNTVLSGRRIAGGVL